MRPGDVIGERFVVERLAGVGGMGEVYRAEDLVAGGFVAIKVLRDAELSSGGRLEQEARVLEGLSHPHIVRYVAHGVTAAGAPWLAMEWLEGESLSARLGREGLRLEESIELALHVAEALAVAHARGVVHRDIKPSNLFLEHGQISRVKVLDFGVARTHGMTRRLTLTGAIVGTPGYMAPEQARSDKGRAVDARADVFSLGAVLFECLTGRPAFEGDHAFAILASLLLSEPPRVREIRGDVPEALDELVAHLLAKDPAARPESGASVARALAAIGHVEGDAMAPRISVEVLTGSERQIISIVAALPPSVADERYPHTGGRFLPRHRIEAIEEEIAPLGGRLEELDGGALLLGLVGGGNPTDQAARAARCALKLRTLTPEARIVLVTGRDEALGGFALGSIAKRAAGLLELDEEAGAVRIDASTQALLDVRFDVTTGPDGIFLRGEREIGSGSRTLLGKPSPYLGRERELRSVRDFLEEGIDEGKPRVAVVLGPPGMGKSRLRHELVEQLKRGAIEPSIAIGRGDPIGAGSSFTILGSAIRMLAQINVSEPLASRRAKLDALVAPYFEGEERARVVAYLGEMIGVPGDDARPDVRAARLNATLMAERIQEAWIDFVEAYTEETPIVCVLEDLQWGDQASIKLVDAALALQGERRFVVLALARPDVHELFPKLWADRELLEVRLGELSRRAGERLVRYFLGDEARDEDVHKLLDRAAGNAFYLEELIRAVADGRGDDLPETVLGMVEARLLALEPEARRVLRAASVFGQTFWWGGVAALIGRSSLPHGRVGLLDRLVERELLVRRRESRFAGEEEYAFRHALVREGSYAMLTDRDRVRGHALAADWLVSVGEVDAAVLADHFERAGASERAAEFFARAADSALAAGDFASAIGFVNRGLASGVSGDIAAHLLAIRADAWGWMSANAQAFEEASQALASAQPGTKAHGRALGAALSSALLLRRHDALSTLMDELERAAPDADTVSSLTFAYASAVISMLVMGERAKAQRFLERMEQAVTPFLGRDPSIAGRYAYAKAYWVRFVERNPFVALGLDREAVASFLVSGDRRYLPLIWAHVGGDLLLLGAYDEAEQELSRARRAALPRSVPSLLVGCYQTGLSAARGAVDEALLIGAETTREAAAQHEGIIGVTAQCFMLDALLDAGRLDDAKKHLAVLWPSVEQLPIGHSWVLTANAALALAEGDPARALAIVDEVLAVSRALAMPHYVSHPRALLTRAEALRALGRMEEAQRALVVARSDLETRAVRISDPAYEQSFVQAIGIHARTLAACREWGDGSS